MLVTQGTVERDPEKIIVPTLEAFKDSESLVVVTTGGAQTQELKKRFPQPNIIIEDFIHFGDVMPYADVYITNGGYGDVMLGIENRLQFVAAGVHERKNEINARIGYCKLGINLKTETPKAEEIKRAVTEVLANSVYKKNVENLSKEFKSFDSNELCTKYIREVLDGPKVKLPNIYMHVVNI
ncbi:MAG: nucleotide disphospho-sugar-binding domain-containing protein [Ferruginibacter sp.]